MFRTRILAVADLPAAKEEVRHAFFSGDTDEIEQHFQDHEDESSTTILGYADARLVGIVTIRWNCKYPPFKQQNIPLIQYIEIRYEDRGRGIGGKMLEAAEQQIALRCACAGICVGLFDAYGPAQRLYVKRGFVPDGRGACRGHTPLREGQEVTMDHDLLLWLVKDLKP